MIDETQKKAAIAYCDLIGQNAMERVSIPCPDGKPGCCVAHYAPRWQALATKRAKDRRESELWAAAEGSANNTGVE